jgi:ubiquitin carboxyl-terminal hydrolase L3
LALIFHTLQHLKNGLGLCIQVLLHFVCFVHHDGVLYELDGRKFNAISHGPTRPETLLQDSCAVVKKYVETTGSIHFNLIALAAA